MCELHNKLTDGQPWRYEVGEKNFQYMVQPIFTSLPPTTTHHPPPSQKICFKRIKRRGWYKISDSTKTNNESEVSKTKSVPRGDGNGYACRGSDKEEEWLLMAEGRRGGFGVRCRDRRRDWLGEWIAVKLMYIVKTLTDEHLAFLSCLHHLPKVNSIPYFW